MSDPRPGGERPAQEKKRITVLTLRYLDGLLTAEELRELNAALAAHAWCRDFFVQFCRLHGELSEALAPRCAAGPRPTNPPRPVPAPPEGLRPRAEDLPLLVLEPPEGPEQLDEGEASGRAAPAGPVPAADPAGSTVRGRQALQETSTTIPVIPPPAEGAAPGHEPPRGKRPPHRPSD
jgi:hypothetical protein